MENVLFKDTPSTKEFRYRILQYRTLRNVEDKEAKKESKIFYKGDNKIVTTI